MSTIRRRAGWIAVLAISAILFLPIFFAVYLHLGVEAILRNHRAEIAFLQEEVPIRTGTRPVLLGPGDAGNAWDLLRPALEVLGDLAPLEAGDYSELRDPDFDWRGAPGVTPELIEQATPSLEDCRRAMRRSDLSWTGPADPDLAAKAGRAGRALCTKAVYAHEAGRGAEAVEWLTTALGVVHDAARTGQRGTWRSLHVVERWVCQEARLILSNHRLSAKELEDFGRGLDLLRSSRPALGLALRQWSATAREEILEDSYGDPYLLRGDENVPWSTTAGWKDFYSPRLLQTRLLNGIRRAVEELSNVPMAPSSGLSARAIGIELRYPAEDVGQLLPGPSFFDDIEAAQLRLDMLRLAVAFARSQVETGRFPLSASEAGMTLDLGRPLRVVDGCIDGQRGAPDLELEWRIGRRTKD